MLWEESAAFDLRPVPGEIWDAQMIVFNSPCRLQMITGFALAFVACTSGGFQKPSGTLLGLAFQGWWFAMWSASLWLHLLCFSLPCSWWLDQAESCLAKANRQFGSATCWTCHAEIQGLCPKNNFRQERKTWTRFNEKLCKNNVIWCDPCGESIGQKVE